MKRLSIWFFGMSLLIGACQSNDTAKTEAASEPALNSTEVAVAAAKTLITDFQVTLRTELLEAMNAGGAGDAIGICNVRAPQILAAHSRDSVWSIARVTDMPRVPTHLASDQQMTILRRFGDSTYGEPHYIEWVAGPDGDSVFTLYQPILIAEMCTNCHGNQDKLAQGVPEKLAALYPQDKAIGYETGDLRGLFVVTMNWPDALGPARQLIKSAKANSTTE